MEKEDSFAIIGIILMIALVVSVVYEIFLFATLYAYADEVECVLPFYCVFTTKISESECYENGVQVNCSESFENYEEMISNAVRKTG